MNLKLAGVQYFSLTIVICLLSSSVSAQQQIDYLSFARGAFPVTIDNNGADLRTAFEHALAAIDENNTPYIVTPRPGAADSIVTLVYELPALTSFEQFIIPNVLETPSPSQTFIKRVAISGSAESAEGPFSELGSVELATHDERDQQTQFEVDAEIGVRWVRIELSGGIDVQREQTYFEFSEIIGYGQQETVPQSDKFAGKWRGRGVLLELHQDDSLVSGCYDRTGDLNGAVNGNMLYATGVDRNDGTSSTFVLTVAPDGAINGVRSSNGAPFRLYTGDIAPDGTDTGCSEPEEIILSCGAIVYGIQFDFDSDQITPESDPVLAELFEGLSAETSSSILIEGHTSSEGSDSYNLDLSERRAGSVVAALVERGLDESRIAAIGRGESDPIATNDEEAGRMLNRRVEVNCSSD